MNLTIGKGIAACLIIAFGSLAADSAESTSWPMWRHDPGRTARSSCKLPSEFHLQWKRQFPRVIPGFRSKRLQFDAGYEPVVLGKTLFMGLSVNDSICAIDTDSGAVKWKFFTDGPVRFAPVAWRDRVFAASDDGNLYCLEAASGKLLWKFKAPPSSRKILGNGRLISLWPVRGGPVLKDDIIYFAAGLWPFEGIFVYALDARSGDVIWLNDRSGSLFLGHPHGAWSFGGPSLQGYLLINGNDLLVPNGSGGVPAYFDIRNGKLLAFCHLANRVPGSWFVAADAAGRLNVDSDLNRELHEDRFYETRWNNQGAWVRPQKVDPWIGRKWHKHAGMRTTISAGGATYPYEKGFNHVKGEILSMVAADAKMFVVTRAGWLYCFGGKQRTPKAYGMVFASKGTGAKDADAGMAKVIRETGSKNGYALVLGIGDGQAVEALLGQTGMHIIVLDPNERKVEALRKLLDGRGVYGSRAVVSRGELTSSGFPLYLASLIVSGDLSASGFHSGIPFVKAAFRSLRPYGGTLCLRIPGDKKAAFSGWVREAKLESAELKQVGQHILLRRAGKLPGTSNYTGNWKSHDEAVQGPLGVLWFDDSVRLFKRSPQPRIMDGIMMTQPKAWLTTDRPYTLKPFCFEDVYTGRVLSKEEVSNVLEKIPEEDKGRQPPQYRPPKPNKNSIWGERMNPMTGLKEPRLLPKSYGCDPGVDYGHLITMRSGTAAYYDKRYESGLINITGIRSGCTNSIIPANGVLSVPYFYEGCTCGYPLLSGIALVNMPEDHEQWMAWGNAPLKGKIKKLGINFGAPGDRMTRAGLLWLDHPSVGGPSPAVSIDLQPRSAQFYYRHSLWMKGGEGFPWISASGVKGAEKILINTYPGEAAAAPRPTTGEYTVTLYFAEPEYREAGKRVFNVLIQGRTVLNNFDVFKAAGGPMRGVVKTFQNIKAAGTIEVRFQGIAGVPIMSGLSLCESRK